MHTFRSIPANTIRRTVDQHSKVSNFRSLATPNIELILWQDTCDCTPAEHHLLIILLFVNSIQNEVMALVPHILVTSN